MVNVRQFLYPSSGLSSWRPYTEEQPLWSHKAARYRKTSLLSNTFSDHLATEVLRLLWESHRSNLSSNVSVLQEMSSSDKPILKGILALRAINSVFRLWRLGNDWMTKYNYFHLTTKRYQTDRWSRSFATRQSTNFKMRRHFPSETCCS